MMVFHLKPTEEAGHADPGFAFERRASGMCQCRRPGPVRKYMGRWQCGFCLRSISDLAFEGLVLRALRGLPVATGLSMTELRRGQGRAPR